MDRPSNVPPKVRRRPRTRLADIEAIGYELSEEHLRLVVGAGRDTYTCSLLLTSPDGGDCADRVDFPL